MARKIIYAKSTGYASDSKTALWIDRQVEIDYKDKLYVDQWSGDVAIGSPTYIVGLPQKEYEAKSMTILEYGQIEGPDDIEWLKQVAYQSTMDGPIEVQTPELVISRIHQLDLRRDGSDGFEVEVLTGDDADTMLRIAKREQVIATFKDIWWAIPIGLAALWWWL